MPMPGLPGGVTVLSVSGSQGEEEPEENPSKEEKQEPGTPMRKAGRPGRKRKHAQVSQRAPRPGGWWRCPLVGLSCPAATLVGDLGLAWLPCIPGHRARGDPRAAGGGVPSWPTTLPPPHGPSEPSCARWHRRALCGSARGPTVHSLPAWAAETLLPHPGAVGPREQSPRGLLGSCHPGNAHPARWVRSALSWITGTVPAGVSCGVTGCWGVLGAFRAVLGQGTWG